MNNPESPKLASRQDAGPKGAVKRRATSTGKETKRGIPSQFAMRYDEGEAGIKLGPTAVLVVTLGFMGVVVALHVITQFKRAIF